MCIQPSILVGPHLKLLINWMIDFLLYKNVLCAKMLKKVKQPRNFNARVYKEFISKKGKREAIAKIVFQKRKNFSYKKGKKRKTFQKM